MFNRVLSLIKKKKKLEGIFILKLLENDYTDGLI